MKLICTYEKLKKAVENNERVITKNLTLPILNNILIKTEDSNLFLSSTNLEIGIHSWFSCKVKESGEITVPAKVLSGIISNLSGDNIELTSKKGTTLLISSGNYKGELKGQTSKDFPIIPKVQKRNSIKIKAQDLLQALNQIIPFTSSSETRPEITGVLFKKEKNNQDLKLVSTDSFRLAEKRILLDKNYKNLDFSFILPQRAASELTRLISGKNEVEVSVDNNQVAFKTQQNELTSRLIEGSYPNYDNFIPSKFKTEILLNKNELIKTIRLVSLMSSRINDIKISIDGDGKKANLKAYASDPDLGENSSSIKTELEGDDIEISFNWRYLLEGLQQVEDDKVLIKFTEETKPVLIKSPEDNSYIYVVMPIRV